MSDMDATPAKLTVEGYISGAWTDITDYTGPERAVDISTAEPPSKPARMTLPLWKQSGGLQIPDWMPIRVSDQSNPADPYPRYFYGFVPSNEQGIANNINETYSLNAIGFDTLWDHPPAQITVKRTYGYLEWLPDHLYAVGDIVRRPGSLDVYIVESIMGDGMSGDTEPFGQTPSPYYIDNNVSWDVAPVSPYVSDLDVLNDLLPEYFGTEVTYTHMNQLCADIGYFEILPGMSPKESMQALATRVADMLGATYPTWVALSPYVRGDRREPITANGYGYLCIKDGVSSNNPNIFVGHTTIGGEFDDGSTRWVCFGQTSVAPTWQFNTPNDNGAHTAPWTQDVAWFDANNSAHAPLLSIEYSDAYVEDTTHKHYNDIVIHRDGNGYANHVDVFGRNGAYGYAEDANAILNAQRTISMSYIDNSEDGPETQEDCEILANQILGKVLTRETVTLSSKTPLSVVVMQGGLRFGAITTALLGLSSQVYPMTRVSMKMGLDGSTWDYEFGAPFRTDLEDVLSGTLRGVRRFPGDHTAPDLVSFADIWFPNTTWVLSNTVDPFSGLVTLVLGWHSSGEADLSHFVPRLRLASENYDRWLPRVDYPRQTITIADLPQDTDFYLKILAVDTSGNPHPPITEANWSTSPTETTTQVVTPDPPTSLVGTSVYDQQSGQTLVTLTWVQSVSDDLAYNTVYRRIHGSYFERIPLDGLYTSYSYLVTPGSSYGAYVTATTIYEIESVPSNAISETAASNFDRPPNLDFEENDLLDATLARYWQRNVSGNATATIDTTTFSSGLQSMKLVHGTGGAGQTAGIQVTRFNLSGSRGETWEYSVHAIGGAGREILELTVVQFDESGTPVLSTSKTHRMTTLWGVYPIQIRVASQLVRYAIIYITGADAVASAKTIYVDAGDWHPVGDRSVSGYMDAAANYVVADALNVGEQLSLIDRARMSPGWRDLGALSGNAFRESSIVWDGTNYHVYYTGVYETQRTDVRTASTPEGIVGATPTTNIVPLKYPSAVYDAATGIYHLWGLKTTGGIVTQHYTSTSATSGFTYSDDFDDVLLIDVGVQKHPTDGYWYAVGFTNPPGPSTDLTLMRAEVPEGPWTDMGNVFDDIGFPPFATAARPDPNLMFVGSRNYIAFSAWGNTMIAEGFCGAICEIDLTTGRVKNSPVVIYDDREEWQMLAHFGEVGYGLSDYQFLRVPGQPDRIFGWSNDAGNTDDWHWGCLDIPRVVVPTDGRRDDSVVLLDTERGVDRAANIRAVLRSDSTWTKDGLVIEATDGGAHGYPAVASMSDATMIVEFTTTGAQASVALIAGVYGADYTLGPAMHVYLSGGVITADVQGSDELACNLTSGIAVADGERHTVALRRAGEEVKLWVDGVEVDSGTLAASSVTDTIEIWTVGAQKTLTQAARYPFIGTVHQFHVAASALPLQDVKRYPGVSTGTVTSVALAVPAEFSVSGSPVTGSGTLAISKANQSANLVYAAPTSGGAAAPAFRALVTADLPSIFVSTVKWGND